MGTGGGRDVAVLDLVCTAETVWCRPCDELGRRLDPVKTAGVDWGASHPSERVASDDTVGLTRGDM